MALLVIFTAIACIVGTILVWNVKVEEWFDRHPNYNSKDLPFWVRLNIYIRD
jgi:hypothetical protein